MRRGPRGNSSLKAATQGKGGGRRGAAQSAAGNAQGVSSTHPLTPSPSAQGVCSTHRFLPFPDNFVDFSKAKNSANRRRLRRGPRLKSSLNAAIGEEGGGAGVERRHGHRHRLRRFTRCVVDLVCQRLFSNAFLAPFGRLPTPKYSHFDVKCAEVRALGFR